MGGAQEDVGCLERLDAPDEEEDEGIRGKAELGAGMRLAARAEDVEVDSGMHDVDVRGGRGVEVDELRGLLAGVGDQPRGLVDHLLLTDLADGRLGAVADRELAVLDLGHGVHGVNERHIPALGRQPADLAREPVVRVDHVEPAFGTRGLGAHESGSQGAQLRRQLLLAQLLEGSCPQMGHANSGFDLDGGGQG